MEATHIVFDREYKQELPDYSFIDRYRQLLSNLPDVESDNIKLQIEDAYLEFYCKCGCHSFLVHPNMKKDLPQLQVRVGVYREIACVTNYHEELNVMLFTDAVGNLSQVTVFYGVENVEPIPDDLEIIGIQEVWTSNIYNEFVQVRKNIR